MDTCGRREPRSCRAREASLQTSKTGLHQTGYPGPYENVGLLVGEELNLPARDAAAAFRRDLDRSNVTRRGNSGNQRVAIRTLRLVHRLEALDAFPAVARGAPAQLTNCC